MCESEEGRCQDVIGRRVMVAPASFVITVSIVVESNTLSSEKAHGKDDQWAMDSGRRVENQPTKQNKYEVHLPCSHEYDGVGT